jgi:hypothetical protein
MTEHPIFTTPIVNGSGAGEDEALKEAGEDPA